jgi:hypothetical protein
VRLRCIGETKRLFIASIATISYFLAWLGMKLANKTLGWLGLNGQLSESRSIDVFVHTMAKD